MSDAKSATYKKGTKRTFKAGTGLFKKSKGTIKKGSFTVGRSRSYVSRRNKSKRHVRSTYRTHRRHGTNNNNNPSKLHTIKTKAIGGMIYYDRASVKLKYTSYLAVTGGGVIQDWNYKMNSIYDCGAGSDTDNAQGYQIYYNLFQRSRVHASSIEVTINNNDQTTSMEALQAVIIPANASNTAILNGMTDWAGILNQPHAKTGIFFDGKGRTSLKHYCKVGTIAGYKSLPLSPGISTFASTLGSDPGQLYSWYVAVYNLSGTTDNDFSMQVRITYYVDFSEPHYENAQELNMRTITGNDFGGTPEEYKEYMKKHALKKKHNFIEKKNDEIEELSDKEFLKRMMKAELENDTEFMKKHSKRENEILSRMMAPEEKKTQLIKK